MYVKNLDDKRDYEKYFYCIPVLGNRLIYKHHLPLFGRTKDGTFVFARTIKFKNAYKDVPTYLKAINTLKGGG